MPYWMNIAPSACRAVRQGWCLALGAALLAPSVAAAQNCNFVARQQTPCAVVSAAVVAQSLGVSPQKLSASDNVSIMGKRMPALTSCEYRTSDMAVRIGQFGKSTAAAFDAKYRSRSDAEIDAALPSATKDATRQATAVTGRSVTSSQAGDAQAQARKAIQGLQFQPQQGIGERAVAQYSGNQPRATLITLSQGETFVVDVAGKSQTREKNLATARALAEATLASCK